jgi:hypothetical protein
LSRVFFVLFSLASQHSCNTFFLLKNMSSRLFFHNTTTGESVPAEYLLGRVASFGVDNSSSYDTESESIESNEDDKENRI